LIKLISPLVGTDFFSDSGFVFYIRASFFRSFSAASTIFWMLSASFSTSWIRALSPEAMEVGAGEAGAGGDY